jgi:hypothetical protein
VPYVIVTVDLEEGARSFGRFEASNYASVLEPGLRVEMISTDTSDGQGIAFSPDETSAGRRD